jgi:hypothetical protein
MIQVVKITFEDGSTAYLKGFMNDGNADVVLCKTHAASFPEWQAPTAARNAERTLRHVAKTETEDFYAP